MLLSDFDLNNLNFWNLHTCTIEGAVTDIVTLNYGIHKLDLYFKFPRCKGICYFEAFRDYAETYSKSIEFMELSRQLKDESPYLEHIYSHTEISYG